MKTMFLTSELNIEQNDENHKSITLVVCRTFLMIHIIVNHYCQVTEVKVYNET